MTGPPPPSSRENQSHDDLIYKVGEFEIRLPFDHLLPEYQKQHRRYDRFLPILANLLPKGASVINIGANCGDTLAFMASSNPMLNYICIEADTDFFSYLELNACLIKDALPNCSITTIREMIGLNVRTASLSGSGGTKTATDINDQHHGQLQTKTLDEICIEYSTECSSLSLLIIDTDGFDYDVLMSAKSQVEAQQPLLFFECQFSDGYQLDGYLEVLHWLDKSGYSDWHLFDNFGGYLLNTNSIATIIQIIEYIQQQNVSNATRTMYYLDILAASATSAELAKHAIEEFRLLDMAKPHPTRLPISD